MSQIRSIKGTHDILPSDSSQWQHLEQIVHDVCGRFRYEEIRTPVFEETRLFSRSVGEDTDIVSKEMYTWEDRDGTSLTLRPELTASVVRSYIQHNLGSQAPVQRLYYMGPLFRRERPQKGRQRQFHQFGVEAFGSENPEQDAEIIAIAWHILSACGLNKTASLQLNSIGSSKCRSDYRNVLKDFIRPNRDQFSETSQKRFDTNPLRILDTKLEHEQTLLEGAPMVSECYTAEDKAHLESLQNFLTAMEIPFTIDPRLVRGLDYYSRTVFEFTSPVLGAQDALLGGGRYDGLVETLGGKPTPGIGFAAGMERFLIAMDDQSNVSKTDVYFICLGEAGLSTALSLTNELRQSRLNVMFDPLRRSLKAQLREANKSGARFALILGDTEMEKGTVVFKDLEKGEQKNILQKKIKNLFDNLTN
ncbi:MAG: histidine--tRNA ligase [Candidatus Marinimicrobia bacterium]|nr:histidine--tRNA ligase [Candidatus Neomarinimicrobiota bacterium]